MNTAIDILIGGYFKRSTYTKALYLIAAGPLGTIYFTALVTGLSLGFSLLVLALVGVLILLAVLVGTLAAAEFERKMANSMLGEDIPPLMAEDFSGLGMWSKVKAMLRSRVTWTGMAFLFAKFPVGIVTISVLGAALYVSGVFTTAFIYYGNVRISLGLWEIDTLGSAFALLPIGLVGLVLLPHIVNALAWASGAMARTMLSRQ